MNVTCTIKQCSDNSDGNKKCRPRQIGPSPHIGFSALCDEWQHFTNELSLLSKGPSRFESFNALIYVIPIFVVFSVPREPEPECKLAERNMTLQIDDCVSVDEVLATSCSGTCGSNATALFESPHMESLCTCCKPSATRTKVVDMICGKWNRDKQHQ